MIPLTEMTFVRLLFISYVVFISWLFVSHHPQRIPLTKSSQSLPLSLSLSKGLPTAARVLYLFLCEHQDEINLFINAFPSVSADIMFLCWRENCVNSTFYNWTEIYTITWSGRVSNNYTFVQDRPTVNHIKIKPQVFIVNEKELNLTKRTTWTTARNLLYEHALLQERRQGWRWAFYTFGDGDIQLACPIVEKLKTDQVTGDELVVAQNFRQLLSTQRYLSPINETDQCFILHDTFLLTLSPAISCVEGMGIPTLYYAPPAQIVYHMDAMFNAIHRDALPFVLPYCARYDERSWYTSQAIFVYRSLCLYGHAMQFNVLVVVRQLHRDYPKDGDPWAIDEDMNLVPLSLIPLRNYMGQARHVSAVVLEHYSGWSLDIVNTDCKKGHTIVNPINCNVKGEHEDVGS